MEENRPLLGVEIRPPGGPHGRGRMPNTPLSNPIEINLACTANVLVAFICGLIYMSNFVNIGLIADKLSLTSVDMGPVFVGAAVGAIIGGLFWPSLSYTMGGANTIIACLTGLALVCLSIGFCTSIVFMYFLYFISGLLIACMDTGSYGLVRVIHNGERSAGPWTTAMAVFFLTGGLLAVLFNSAFTSVLTIYFDICVLTCVVIFFNWLYQYFDEKRVQAQPLIDCSKITWNTYAVEILCSLSMGCSDGTSTSVTSYLETYITDTGVITDSLKSYVVGVFWAGMIAGEVTVLLTQLQQKTEMLLLQQGLSAIAALAAVSGVLVFSNSADYLWAAIAVCGFGTGVAFCVLADIANRLSKPTAISSTIIFLGINAGLSGVPFIVSAVWDIVGSSALFYVLISVLALSLVVQVTPYFKHVEL